jgi:curli biogenesis system outer membrane secretion channel CsgG
MRIHFPLFAILLAAGVPALPAVADEAWKPYLEENEGEVKDLGDPRKLKDKDWLAVRYGEYSGYKSRLGVVVSEAKDAYSPEYKKTFTKLIMDLSGTPERLAQPQNHIEDLVRQALTGTHRFTMLERTSAAEDIAREQALADSGRVDPSTAPAAGKITGAEYTVMATLIELNPEKETKEIKSVAGEKKGSGLYGADLGVKQKVAFCRMNLRVIRVETGEIVVDQTVDGTCTTTGLTGLAGFGLRTLGKAGGAIAGKKKKEAPISNAMQACANKAAYSVATGLEESSWQSTVASVTGSQLTITGGTNVGLQDGMILTLLAKGADVVDPETNEVIGFETSEIGQVKIVAIQETFSTCEIIQGGEGAKQGDLVRRENPKR